MSLPDDELSELQFLLNEALGELSKTELAHLENMDQAMVFFDNLRHALSAAAIIVDHGLGCGCDHEYTQRHGSN